MPITVTIESVRILSSGDPGGRAGQIQLAAALYEDPQSFRRSVHAANRFGRMSLHAGELIPNNQIPGPMTLCLPRGTAASFALQAWDDDDNTGDRFDLEFDDDGVDDDDVLQGIRHDFGDRLPSGLQTARSNDLEVSFRVSRAAGSVAPCPLDRKP